MAVLRSPYFTASGTSGNQNLVTQKIDNIEYIVGVELNGVPVDPTNSLWNSIATSDEAVAPYNNVTGQLGKSPVDFIAPQVLTFKYFDETNAKRRNGSSDPKSLNSSDSGFYGSGIVGGPKQFQQPGTSGAYGALNPNTKAAYAYPIDISTDQDHLMIRKYKYARSKFGDQLGFANLSGPGQDTAGKEYDGFAILPMPKVSDSNGAEWGDSDLNIFGIGAVEALMTPGRMAQQATKNTTFSLDTPDDILKLFQGGVPLPTASDLTGAAGVGAALGGSALLKTLGVGVEPDTLLARASGAIANPNAELLFQGPVLRDFGFQFLMIARSQEEGKMIRQMIRWFKQGAAPKYRNQALLGTPDIFRLRYVTPTNPGILNRFHDMALRTITVDYAPDGFWSAYEDAHPVACRMSLQFTELKPVYDVDYEESFTGPYADPDEAINAPANGVGY